MKNFYKVGIIAVIFAATLFFANEVLAQTCPTQTDQLTCTPMFVCGNACVETVPSCSAGQTLNCDSCSCGCDTTRFPCAGCTAERNSGTTTACDAQNRNANRCTGVCEGCKTGYRDCGTCTLISTILTGSCTTTSGEEGLRDNCGNCVSAGPRAVTRQYSFPGTEEAGFINIQGHIRTAGDLRTAGDVYLNSGKAIRIDAQGATSNLGFGNYGSNVEVGGVINRAEFHFRLHADDNALSELLLQQGNSDRWSLSVRDGLPTTASGADFEIRRGVTNWPRVLAIDYNTGEVTIDVNVRVSGDLIPSRLCLGTGGTDCRNVWPTAGAGEFVPRGGPCDSGQGIRIGGDDPAWECADWPTGTLTNITTPSGGGLDIDPTDPTDPTRNIYLYDCGIGQILHVNLAGNWECVNAPTAGTTYIPGDYVTIGADNRISATHANGCFGPVYMGPTNLARNGDRGGYVNANTLCNVPLGSFTGSHVCTAQEISNSINCGAFAGKDINSWNPMWFNNLGPSLPTPTNDCGGWSNQNADAVGVVYAYDTSGGRASTASCNQELKFACCR